jgi:hypothetical protein
MTEQTNTADTVDTAETAKTTDAEVAEIRVGRLDDAHLAWFIAESECERALKAWRAGIGDDADIAYCSYLAALDREESAAQRLNRLWHTTRLETPTLVQRMRNVVH